MFGLCTLILQLLTNHLLIVFMCLCLCVACYISLCFIRADGPHVSFSPTAGTRYPECLPGCFLKKTEHVACSRLRRVAVCILEGPLLMLGVGWEREGRASRTQGVVRSIQHTHCKWGRRRLQEAASEAKGERWRPREDHTDIEAGTSNISFLFYTYLPPPFPPPSGFVLNRTPFLPLCEMPVEGNCRLKEYFILHLTKINILIVSILLTGNKLISRDVLFYISIKFHKRGKNENYKWKAAKIWMKNWTGMEIWHRANICSMCQGEIQVRTQLLKAALSKYKMRHEVLTEGVPGYLSHMEFILIIN